MKNFFWIILIIVVSVMGCVDPPEYPDEPVLSFISVSKDQVIAQTIPENSNRVVDSIEVVFGFTDGDGDLGVTDSNNVFLNDSRLPSGAGESFRINNIPQQGVGNGISGEISVVIPNLFCFPNSAPRDTMQYLIQVVDKSGKRSNIIQTSDIILVCD